MLVKSISPKAGGHQKAAGMPIDKDTVWILEKIKEAIIEKNNAKSLILNNKQNKTDS